MEVRRIRWMTLVGLAMAVLALVLSACGGSGDDESTTSAAGGESTDTSGGGGSASGTLNGSGSSFQLAFMQQAIEEFKSVNSNITVNYGGGGSGKGRTDLAQGVVDFAGSDSPIADDEKADFGDKTILYFPDVIAPITISYNLSGVDELKLSGPVIARIFEAKIKKWNDPAIKKENSGVDLPDTSITIARRSDSGRLGKHSARFARATRRCGRSSV